MGFYLACKERFTNPHLRGRVEKWRGLVVELPGLSTEMLSVETHCHDLRFFHQTNRAVKYLSNLEKKKKKPVQKATETLSRNTGANWSPCKCQHVFFTAQGCCFLNVSQTVKQRVTTAFILYNEELDYLDAIWPAGVPHMKHSNAYFQT